MNGSSLQPRSGAAPKTIVLLLHGFGSSGTDMISLAPQWQDALPDTLFLAPHVFTTFREQRSAVIARVGENAYKIVYSLVSLAGLSEDPEADKGARP